MENLKFKLTRPLVTFDLETTGLDVLHDRIVSLGYHKLHPEGGVVQDTLYFNPGIVISPEAVIIHGIDNDQVKHYSPFSEVAPLVFSLFTGCDVAHFNGNQFDVLLLSEEFNRCGISWPALDMRSIDVKQLFHKKEGRSLADAVRFYTNQELTGAHDAGVDTLATVGVLNAQLERYPDLAGMSIQQLHEFSKHDPKSVDLAGKISRDLEGDYIYAFGKHKGRKISEEMGYAHWMLNADFPTNTKQWLSKILYYE